MCQPILHILDVNLHDIWYSATLPFVIRSSGCLRKVAAVSVEVGLLSMLNAILHDGDTAYGGM